MIPKKYEFDAAVIIGRWQMWHMGHRTLLDEAFRLAPQVVIVVGSSFMARDPHNPFTAPERGQMIVASLTDEERKRITFLPVRDYFDNPRWTKAVREGVASLTQRADKVALVAFRKDETTYYVDNFAGWSLKQVRPQVDIDATALRKVYFESADDAAADLVLGNYMHPNVVKYLRSWSKLPAYRRVAQEHKDVVEYRKEWPAPYHLTADALVRVNDHILLIRRKSKFGDGLLAMPGGFLNPGEQFFPAALRELREETGFAPLYSTMEGALRGSVVRDHPLRSPRGRLVTQVFYFALGYSSLPEVHAADDAGEAVWVPIEELGELQDQFFEDHYSGVTHFVGEPE